METNYVIANSMKMQRHVKNKSNYMHTECIRYISKGFYLDLRRVLAFLFLTLAMFLYLNFDMCLQNETISSRLFRSDVGSAFRMISFSDMHKSHRLVPHRYFEDLLSIDHLMLLSFKGILCFSLSDHTYWASSVLLRYLALEKDVLWSLHLCLKSPSDIP